MSTSYRDIETAVVVHQYNMYGHTILNAVEIVLQNESFFFSLFFNSAVDKITLIPSQMCMILHSNTDRTLTCDLVSKNQDDCRTLVNMGYSNSSASGASGAGKI